MRAGRIVPFGRRSASLYRRQKIRTHGSVEASLTQSRTVTIESLKTTLRGEVRNQGTLKGAVR